MFDSPESSPEHEHRLIRGVWQPRTVDPKDNINPFQPAPKKRLVQCFIVKDPVSQAFCLFLQLCPQLSLTNKGKFLLASREISHVSRTEFSIWNDLDELSEDSEFLIGQLLSNLSRTEYLLYDYRQCGTPESYSSCWRPQHGVRPGSVRVAEVHYNMTLGKPQQFHSLIHSIRLCTDNDRVCPIRTPDVRYHSHRIIGDSESGSDESGKSRSMHSSSEGAKAAKEHEPSDPALDKSASWAGQNQPKLEDSVPHSKSDSSLHQLLHSFGSKHGVKKDLKVDTTHSDGADAPLTLKTKAYLWDESLKRYYARFDKRADVQGSSKNFQMVLGNETEKEKDETVLQFGEVSPEVYFMDYAYPLTAFEAFGICLTRLD
ncbi:hypothetical protein Mapa_006947 [Marchantia paleacea]|nr:hypothetical protein Mapa_006947 [Marchantia paleacea]